MLRDRPMIPHGVARINGHTDTRLLAWLKRLGVRVSLWLEYRFWPFTRSLFDDRSALARRLGRAGWLIGVVGVLYVIGHLVLAVRRGWL